MELFTVFLSLPAIKHKHAKTLSCAVNALVDATPISGPASIVMKLCDSLAILLSELLTILNILLPFFFANFKAANVSAVSPDCEINIESVFFDLT